MSGVRVVSDPRVEIEATCEVHQGSGRLVVRREGDRIVVDGHADDCCVIFLGDPATMLLFGVLGELWGDRPGLVGALTHGWNDASAGRGERRAGSRDAMRAAAAFRGTPA